jgi:hypothetical protein
MSESNGQGGTGVPLNEVKAAAEDLLLRIADPEAPLADLFPDGVSHLAVTVKAGDVEVTVEIRGIEHSHVSEDEEGWLDDDMDDLYDEDDRP